MSHLKTLIVGLAAMACWVTLAVGQTGRNGISPSSQMIYEGFTEARHDVMVAATEIGRLESVSVEVGDEVTTGQVIGQLEDALQQSSVRIAELQISMTGELEASRAEVELHTTRTQLLRKLAADGMARPDELARAETDLRIASAKYLTVQEQMKLRELELERYRLQVERRLVRVPMDGVVSEVFHRDGEYITPADPAVVRLLVVDKLYGVFNVPVEEMEMIRVGTPARIFLRSSGKSINVKVTSISPAIDGESGTVQLRVELDNSKREMLVGDRCTLRVLPSTIRSATRAAGAKRQ
ncbi:MAG: efflux RND transporter periplasmic adaptor subunit [Planctomycetota bacterium]